MYNTFQYLPVKRYILFIIKKRKQNELQSNNETTNGKESGKSFSSLGSRTARYVSCIIDMRLLSYSDRPL